MARLKVKQISDYVSATESIAQAELAAVSNGLSNEISSTNSDVVSLDAFVDTVSNGLSSEISSTNSDVVSLDAFVDTVSNGLSSEISDTNSDVASIDTVLGGLATGSNVEAISNGLSNEISDTNSDVVSLDAFVDTVSNALSSEISATNSDVASLDTAFNGFAKEPYLHGVVSDIVTGTGQAGQPLDASGAPTGDNVSETGATAIIDLANPIEGNNGVEHEANFVKFTINGLEIGHDALTFSSATTVVLDYATLGYDLEADDVIEYKYIQD